MNCYHLHGPNQQNISDSNPKTLFTKTTMRKLNDSSNENNVESKKKFIKFF